MLKSVSANNTFNPKIKIVNFISNQNCIHIFPHFYAIEDQKWPFLLTKSLNFQLYAHNLCYPEPSGKTLQEMSGQGTHYILVKITFPHISPF